MNGLSTFPRDLGPASVSAAGIGRFHLWQGRSGRRYLFSIVGPEELDADAVVLLACRQDAGRHCLDLAGDERGLARLTRAARSLPSAEFHIHLLARSEEERSSTLRDLRGEEPGVVVRWPTYNAAAISSRWRSRMPSSASVATVLMT
jgi:hypothetical protein